MSRRNKTNADYPMEELFPDEAERNRVNLLPEVEREELILEKVEKLQNKLDRELLLNEKDKAIEDIKSRRKNKYQPDSKKRIEKEIGEVSSDEYHKRKSLRKNKKDDFYDEEFNDDDLYNKDILDDDNYSDDFNRKKKRSKAKVSKKKPDDSGKKFLEDDNKSLDSFKIIHDEDEKDKEGEFKLTYQNLEQIRVPRILLEKYHNHKLFDKTIKNCYVRLNLGGKNTTQDSYMIALIKDVINVPEESYRLGDSVLTKYFIAQHADNEKRFNFSIVSNSEFQDYEFQKWKSRMEKQGFALPNKATIVQKYNDLENMKNYIYSYEEIHQTLNEKRAERIIKRDPTLSVTQEYEELNEKFNACTMKINDLEDDKKMMENMIADGATSDNKEIGRIKKRLAENEEQIICFKKQKKDIEKYLQILNEMLQEKLQEKEKATLEERSYRINLKNLMNQKQKDKKMFFLNKKRAQEEADDLANPYKRRECAPLNRFTVKDSLLEKEKQAALMIKMTKPKEDIFDGTPKELYDKRVKEIEETKKIYSHYNIEFGKIVKENHAFEKINDSTNKLSTTKKGYFGLLKTAGIDMRKFIEFQNQMLLEKYDIDDPTNNSNIQDFEFI